MGVWNETEARSRFDEAMKRKRATADAKRAEEERAFAARRASAQRPASTLFDAVEESERKRQEEAQAVAGELETKRHQTTVEMQMDLLSLGDGAAAVKMGPGVTIPTMLPPEQMLLVLNHVRSVRGFARHEYARVYAVLGPLYFDLVRARTHSDPEVFRLYRDPEKQAAMLAQLKTFSESDTALGWYDRTERLKAMMGVFENAALREFEGGYEEGDIDGRMRRYAHVLITLNGGNACIQLFVQKHPVLYEKREELGNPLDCFEYESLSRVS